MRGWLALVMVGLLGGTALAYRVALNGTCGQDGVSLPRDGAVDVPTNALLWRLYRNTTASTRALELRPYATVESISAGLSESAPAPFVTPTATRL